MIQKQRSVAMICDGCNESEVAAHGRDVDYADVCIVAYSEGWEVYRGEGSRHKDYHECPACASLGDSHGCAQS